MVTLLFVRAARLSALCILISYCVYAIFVINLDGTYYYSCSALLCFITGLSLTKQNKAAAFYSYMLVISNGLGFLIWLAYLPPLFYNVLSMFLLIAQAIAIIPRGGLRGLRDLIKHNVANSFGFNGRQQDSAADKIKQSKAQ